MESSIYEYWGIRQTGYPVEMLAPLNFRDLFDCTKNAELSDDFIVIYETCVTKACNYLENLASNPKFFDSIQLSNKNFARVLKKYIKMKRSSSKYRSTIRTLMMYAQRFAMKNDTVSYFGPCGWGRFDKDTAEGLIITCDNYEITTHTFVSNWAAQVLLNAMVNREDNINSQIPKWRPGTTFDKKKHRLITIDVHDPNIVSVNEVLLLNEELAIAEMIENNYTISQLLTSVPNAFPFLVKLNELSIITIIPEIPVGTYDPLKYIKENPCYNFKNTSDIKSFIEKLESNVSFFSESPYTVRSQIIKDMDQSFEVVADAPPLKGSGKHYEDRYIFYEDGVVTYRNLIIGGNLRKDLQSIVPVVNIWMHNSIEMRKRQQAIIFRKLDELQIEELSIYDYVSLLNDDEALKESICSTETQVYEKNLSLYEELNSKPIEDVISKFNPKNEKYYTSIDVSIAAPSVEEINKGNYLIILAECHTNLLFLFNAVLGFWPIDEHYEKFYSWLKQFERTFQIVNPIILHDNRCLNKSRTPLVNLDEYNCSEYEQSIKIRDLKIVKENGHYKLVWGKGNCPIIQHYAKKYLYDHYHMLPFTYPILYNSPKWQKDNRIKKRPRLQYNNIVFQRACWILSVDDFSHLRNVKIEACIYYEIVKIFRKHGIPKEVYVKFYEQPKPIYISLENPVLVHILHKNIAKTNSDIFISEMLPNSNELWLLDKEGNHHTTEFRMMLRNTGNE